MELSPEMKAVVQNSPYCTLVTMNEDNTPHPIIVGGKKLEDGSIVIGIYKMEQTQKNLATNAKAWLIAATLDNGPKGFRFEGKLSVADQKVVFIPDTAEAMI